ncbi:MAG TPA: 7TM-DISM domain-containing protein, partial [Cytophagaceae bacterium]
MLTPLTHFVSYANCKRYMLLFFLLLLANINISSHPVIIDNTSEDFLVPVSGIRILKDTTRHLSIDDVLSRHSQFQNFEHDKVGEENAVYWAHFQLIDSSETYKNWILQLSLHSEDARVYMYSQGKLIS